MKDTSDVIKKTEKIFRVIEEVTGEERLVTITSHPYGFEPADIPVLIDDLPFIAEGEFESADDYIEYLSTITSYEVENLLETLKNDKNGGG